ncbi:MAG: sporulation protein YunB [Firmicutes bacterium]|nr:sporulation protein YunB [Bacillota bacterium]
MRRKKLWRRRRPYPPARRILRLLLFATAAAVTFALAQKQLTPLLEAGAEEKCHAAALIAMQQAVSQALEENPEYGEYQKLIHVEKNNDGQIVLLSPDTMRINRLTADIAVRVEQALDHLSKQRVSLPLGSVFGSPLLAATGPDVTVGLAAAAAPEIRLQDRFESAGINQVRHSISLSICAEIILTAPFHRQKIPVESRVLLTESVIVGTVPAVYMDMNQ